METGNSPVTPKRKTAAKRKTREKFGQVKALPSGRYHASYMGPDGKRHNGPSTFDNMTDARGWLSIQQAAIYQGTWNGGAVKRSESIKQGSGLTLGEYANEWLANRRTVKGNEPLRPSTIRENRRLIENVMTDLTPMRLSAITRDDVRAWNAAQMATGKKTQASRAYGLLKTIMATAVEDEKIVASPCTIRGAASATTGRKVEPPTDDELEIMVQHMPPKYKAMVVMAAWGGFRFGELTELRRKDIFIERDEDGNVDLIRVSVTRGVEIDEHGKFVVGPPKTEAGIRTITLPPFTNEEVIHHLDTFVGPGNEDLLFPAKQGGHMRQSTFAKAWYPARAAAGRSDVPFHALRHYHGTKFGQIPEITTKELQDRLGHASYQAAMRYQHSTGRDAELVRLLRK